MVDEVPAAQPDPKPKPKRRRSPPRPKPKPIWTSRTFWTNVVAAVALGLTAAEVTIPGITELEQAEIVAALTTAANFVLRIITKQPVTLTK